MSTHTHTHHTHKYSHRQADTHISRRNINMISICHQLCKASLESLFPQICRTTNPEPLPNSALLTGRVTCYKLGMSPLKCE